MLYTENGLDCRRGNVNRPGAAQGVERQNCRRAQSGEFLDDISRAIDRAYGAAPGEKTNAAYPAEEDLQTAMEKLSGNHRELGKVIDETAKEKGKLNREELLQLISEHREEILKKLKNGETGVKIPIGSMSLTEEEWEKLLKSFDDAQEKIQESIRRENEEELPEKRPDTTVNGDKLFARDDTGHDVKSLEELAAEVGIQGKVVEKTGEWKDYFPGMQVITKVGNCNVQSGIWSRTDFPFWEYFKAGTSAEALNNWQPSGPQPDMLNPKIQSSLRGIGYGKVSILIPEKLQEKMDADPAYAEEIYRKVAKWKEDYDAWDNSVAASLGMNVAAHQFSKSYCVQLDEDGNVGNFTVVGGGLDITENKEKVEDNWIKRRNAAILFHKQHLARMGYTGITGTAGIVAEEGENSPLALLRAALMGIVPVPEDKKENNAD